MRERLIELIQDATHGCAKNWVEIVADHLLAHDVMEVVRCGKCKYWGRMGYDPLLERAYGYCRNRDFPFMCESDPSTSENDFCSYGIKKGDE